MFQSFLAVLLLCALFANGSPFCANDVRLDAAWNTSEFEYLRVNALYTETKSLPHVVKTTDGSFMVHEQSRFTIQLMDDAGKARHSPLRSDENLYAWLIGPAMLVAQISWVEGGLYQAEFTAYDPGVYSIHVDGSTVTMDKEGRRTITWQRVLGSPFKVVVTTPSHRTPDLSNGCTVAWPANECQTLEEQGRYVRCNSRLKHLCMASGWVWLPNNCYYRLLTTDDLVTEKPFWVVFAGSSVLRGLFFSMIDTIHSSAFEALTSTQQAIYKCWGTLEVTYGKGRFTYRDFRLNAFERPGDVRTLELFSNYTTNLKTHIQHLKEKMDDYGGRAAFVLEVPMHPALMEGNMLVNDLAKVFQWLDGWKGVVYVITRPTNPSIQLNGNYTSEKAAVRDSIAKIGGDLKIYFFDADLISMPFFHEMEAPFSSGNFTLHHHKVCDIGGRRICSSVTEMLAHIFSHQIRHLSYEDGGVGAGQTNPLPFEFCYQCPPQSTGTSNHAPWFNYDVSYPKCSSSVSFT